MFKLKKTNTFSWPVRIKVPQDGGTFGVSEIALQFEQLPQEAFNDLVKAADMDFNAELLRKTVRGWEKVCEEDGTPIPFSDEALEQLLSIPWARNAAAEAYMEAVSGNRAKRKN